MVLMRDEWGNAAGELECKRADLALDAVEADGTFSGYASLFNKADLGRDVIEPGAFARSIAARKAGGVRMLFQHDPNQPIGTWKVLREDARGLFVSGRLAAGSERAGEVLSLLRAGALDGLSIGFRTVRARTDKAAGVRRILEADLWEISVVTFPMMPEARIDRVKRDAKPLGVGAMERWLRQSVGLSGLDAQAASRRGLGQFLGGRGKATAALTDLAQQLRQATRIINAKGYAT